MSGIFIDKTGHFDHFITKVTTIYYLRTLISTLYPILKFYEIHNSLSVILIFHYFSELSYFEKKTSR